MMQQQPLPWCSPESHPCSPLLVLNIGQYDYLTDETWLQFGQNNSNFLRKCHWVVSNLACRSWAFQQTGQRRGVKSTIEPTWCIRRREEQSKIGCRPEHHGNGTDRFGPSAQRSLHATRRPASEARVESGRDA
jgi:hypothetical protein